ncbi:endonuclease domain-containing protein [Desulfatibacillum aliphaticivorans]|uniref:endonuclease domain-containing protein n=1 Tax=Desulfatibacillum aliphaticivorans TaxID=218208 RepID=UPI000483A4E7|nr:endonuclease domain-containing protein [Desulfatibacillum aliphaticivorans]
MKPKAAQSMERAKALRSNMTEAEKKLWQRLRKRQVQGCKFRRQFSIGAYIVDFVCLEKRLIVELDGGQHKQQASYDSFRTAWLEANNFCILRFWNNQVMQNTDEVVQAIFNKLSQA